MWQPYLAITGAIVVIAGLGMYFTDIGQWYFDLKKPRWQPPDWLFGPAWTTIYCFIIASVGMTWNSASKSQHTAMLLLILLNLILNALWSLLFFTWRRPDWALYEVVLLWLSIVALMYYFHSISALGSWLLLPYLLWVSFAAFLTLTIVRLNPSGS